ncbi:VOC family protein [Oceanomicrobium pacificus]|uniref:VOC family protein n=1 Tax=Oceanomicrobium pacificus TaxID=2692916 RepID=A0A6B0TWF2_9RHOB|nr:VOC family protein [Oceanomicrobium pacificus]MXU66075.1 VOC family protein [Oceanomicrobium pacificus]
MDKVQVQGIHHVTLNGADRQTSIDFWQGVLGMTLFFEQPNLDEPELGHLYFDSGDGTTITVFTDEGRKPSERKLHQQVGSVHHLALSVSQATYRMAEERLKAHGFAVTLRDRGFMDSLYFREPLGLLIELASYKFEPPQGCTHAQVLAIAHAKRVAAGDDAIATQHVADALVELSASHVKSLSPS